MARRTFAARSCVSERRVEVDRVRVVRERLFEISSHPMDAVLLRQRAQLPLVAPDEDRIGHQPRAVRHRDAPLLADRDDRANEVLVEPHASRDAVHDDADRVSVHVRSLRCGGRGE
jgi:hypothetical protein